MASQPTSRTLQPPPDLPNMPDVSETLTGYLRNFSLWCRHGFADKLSGSSALPGVMLMANDAPAGTTPPTFMLRVDSQGILQTIPMALASGDLIPPPIRFGPICLSQMQQDASPGGSSNAASFVMMGLNLSLQTTLATRAWVTVNGTVSNTANNGETSFELCYGTGTPPATGSLQSGTVVGMPVTYEASSGGSVGPFSLTGVISGVTPGTAYWFDIAIRVNAGTGNVTNVTGSAMGLP